MHKFRQFTAFGVVLLLSVVQCQLLNAILPTTPTTTAAPPYQGQPYCTAAQAPATSLPTCADASLVALKNARSLNGIEDRSSSSLPSWINIPLARQGQVFANNNLVSVILGFLLGIASTGYPDSSNMLSFARAGFNSSTNQIAGGVTVVQILVWYQDFLKDSPNSNTDDILISLQRVRNIHTAIQTAAVQQMSQTGYLIPDDFYTSQNTVLTTALNGPFYQDLYASNIPQNLRVLPISSFTNITAYPFNPQVQALVQFVFYGYNVLFPDKLGMDPNDKAGLWAFNHFWAVVGYAMGIDDQYNIALMPDLPTQQQFLQSILTNFTIPTIFNMNFNQKCMAEIFLNSMGPGTGGLFTGNLMLYRLAKDILQIDAPATYAVLTAQEQATSLVLDSRQISVAQALPSTPLNAAFWTSFYTLGVDAFGTNFLTQDWRARNVYFAKSMDTYNSPNPNPIPIQGPGIPLSV
jgi:hypothetical protein